MGSAESTFLIFAKYIITVLITFYFVTKIIRNYQPRSTYGFHSLYLNADSKDML